MIISGMNGETTKRINRQQVLRLLSTEPGISRTEIAARMGLVKMTVSNIITEMLRSEMIRETKATGIGKAGAGRKLTGLCFSENAPAAAALWLGGNELHAGIFSMEMRLMEHAVLPAQAGDITDRMVSAVEMLAGKISRPLLGVGLAVGSGWDISLKDELQSRLDIPVYAASDAAADALAFYRFSSHERFVCLSVTGSGPFPCPDGGVRAGVMVGDTMLGGADGCIPVGSMVKKGVRLADISGLAAVCRRISEELGVECRTLSDVRDACLNAPNGNELLCEVFGPLVDAVCNLSLTVRPEVLVLDQGLSDFGDELHEYFCSMLRLRLGDEAPAILPARLGPENTLHGAACLVLEKVFSGALGYEFFFKE